MRPPSKRLSFDVELVKQLVGLLPGDGTVLLHGLLIGAGDIGVTELNTNLVVVRDVGRNIGLCVCQAASARQSLPHLWTSSVPRTYPTA